MNKIDGLREPDYVALEYDAKGQIREHRFLWSEESALSEQNHGKVIFKRVKIGVEYKVLGED